MLRIDGSATLAFRVLSAGGEVAHVSFELTVPPGRPFSICSRGTAPASGVIATEQP